MNGIDKIFQDMNEPFNFVCPFKNIDGDLDDKCPVKCPNNKYDFPDVRIRESPKILNASTKLFRYK